MDPRVLILTIPSLLILGLLIFHSWRTLPGPRAAAFWCGVLLFGILRGVALRWVTVRGLEASFPYVIHDPLFPVLGVPIQEITGWAIVIYIGWWLGHRFSEKLFAQIAWACLFLGAISWTVESAAVAAGWWHWTVPVSNPLFINVPFIGIMDWFFVGVDFLLPFMAITAPALARRPVRYLALLAFPLHFGAHCFINTISEAIPIPLFHLAHWALIGILIWLAARSATVDHAFREHPGRRIEWIPLVGLAIILLDAAAVELLLVRRPELLFSILPAATLALHSLRPALGSAVGAAGLILGVWVNPLLLAAVPPAAAMLLGWGRRHSRWAPAAVLALMSLLAFQVHTAGARKHEDLVRRLDSALAARDRADLVRARQELEDACRNFPGSHVPFVLLGEIHYRTDQLARARPLFLNAIRIKQNDIQSFNYLAVIDLRLGQNASAARFAEEGLKIDPRSLELMYLRQRATGGPIQEVLDRFAQLESKRAHTLASLAYEVGDLEGAIDMLERGLAQWPRERLFYQSRVKLALAQGDETRARQIASSWRSAFPSDAAAHEVAASLGMP